MSILITGGANLKIKNILLASTAILFLSTLYAPKGDAQGYNVHTVQRNESMWKISVKYQIGLSEIIQANPTIKNPALIYPNQKLNIPNIDTVKNVESEILVLVNDQRRTQGLKPLTMDWELQRVARIKSQDMAQKGYFSHQSPTYGSPFDMMQQFGISYKFAGENIASGQRTPQDAMKAWMNSSGHRANILKPEYTHLGVGYYRGGSSGYTWTQMFISK
jgi:uncharacterized YkwD family protein/spore coat assembly protein SafA